MKESNACVPYNYSLMFHLFQCFPTNKSITQFENEKSPMHVFLVKPLMHSSLYVVLPYIPYL